MAILNNSNAISSGGYDINNSLRFRASASAYLSRTPASNGDRQKWTWSAWVKRGASGVRQGIFLAQTSGAVYWGLEFETGNNLNIYDSNAGGSTALTTTALYRDFGAWYHIVVAEDTTQATASNRCKIYVNGNQVTSFVTADYPTQNSNTQINTGSVAHRIGNWITSNLPLDGYLAEVNFIDGSAKTPSDFGETDTTTGSWKPKAYTGTYGTNGFYLKFSDIATTSGSNAGLGKDFSGNANYWTTNNISVTAGTTYDAMIDSPTLTSATVANYCTLNPLPYYGGFSVLSRGNLQFTSGNTNWMRALATFAVSSGKWYWEVTANNTLSQMHGIVTATTTSYYAGATNWVGYDATGYGYFSDNGDKWNNNAGASYGASYGAGDIIGIAFDADNGKLYFSKNGTFQASGDPAAGTNAAFTGLTNGPYVPAVSLATTSGANTCDANFGQRPFSYTPPTGFVRLNTFNLPDSTIKKGNTVMDATLATGNNSTQVITNAAGFRPDFVWLKIRSASENHIAYDSVRGVQQYLVPNLTGAEATLSSGLTSFNSNGFTLGNANPNYAGSPTFVAWQWQAGSSTVTNTSGSISSQVRANTTTGFSIVTWTGTGTAGTVGHGLGVAPKWIIVKRRDSTSNWSVYHANLNNSVSPQNYKILLDSNGAYSLDTTVWNSTAPTSSVFSIGASSFSNVNTGTYVAYCFAEINGFSKIGTYVPNGSADGTFVYLGFRPKFIMIKYPTAGTASWVMYDSIRNTTNISSTTLLAQSSNAEATISGIDMLSNGFKLRGTSSEINVAGGTQYIYIAFAENPFKHSNAR